MRQGPWFPILIVLVLAAGLGAGCTATPGLSPTAASTPQPLPATTSPTPRAPDISAPATLTPTFAPAPTDTATPTPLPPTATETSTATPSPQPPTATDVPTSTPSPVPPTPTVTPAPSATTLPTPAPPPTAAASPYRFLPVGEAQPDPSHPCPSCPHAPAYIVGRVVDAAGRPLANVRLLCYNEWHRYPIVASKAGGEYDFAIIQAETTWHVVVLDQADQPISPEVAVHFDPHETCRYLLDWRRSD